MRLLNVNTRQLEEFFGDAIPPYAILSHTWGQEEVLLQDLTREGHQQKQGYAKIEGCCQQAIKDDLLWIWVDTCCIDKTSSAELSEVINSMFRWYKHSRVCYAYLEDVPSGTDIHEQESAFRKSRWFTRGWTLQELLAPQNIKFYYADWTIISHANTDSSSHILDKSLIDLLGDITSIDTYFFGYYSLSDSFVPISAACVFSWMARRSTTRVEDEAYCLLGLLNINMPLLYGEGDKAFIRLQEAILSDSDDISPLAWGYHRPCMPNGSYLARSPITFLGHPSSTEPSSRRIPKIHTTVTGRGLHTELLMVLINAQNKVWLGIVEEEEYNRSGIAIILEQIPDGNGDLFMRVGSCPPVPFRMKDFPRRTAWAIRRKQIYIAHYFDYRLHTRRIATSIFLEKLLPCVQYRSRASIFQDPEYGVRVSFIAETDYSFSSSWPSVSDRSLFHAPQRPSYVCFGPQSNVFYMIFSNEKQDGFAVRIELEWGQSFPIVAKTAFCVLSGEYIHTALEHCRGTEIGNSVPQFTKDMRWTPYLGVKNVLTGEAGHLDAINRTPDDRGEIRNCKIVWKSGVLS